MNWIKRNLSLLLLIFFLISTLVTGCFYLCVSTNDKVGNILGGVCTGLLIATIEFLITLDERIKLDKIKSLKVKKVLFHRAEESYYRELIKDAKENIDIMGVTAFRFLNDFASADSSSSDNKVLIDALNRNVHVKILLPDVDYLLDQNDKDNFKTAKDIMKKINALFPSKFSYKYFKHEPAHSIFSVDNESIIGPVIPGLSSKDTPGIHMLNSSKYAKTYLDYFKTCISSNQSVLVVRECFCV